MSSSPSATFCSNSDGVPSVSSRKTSAQPAGKAAGRRTDPPGELVKIEKQPLRRIIRRLPGLGQPKKSCSPHRVIQIGIRGSIYSPDEHDWAKAQGIRIICLEEFTAPGPSVMAEARAIVGDSQPTSPLTLALSIRQWRPGPEPRRSAASRRERRNKCCGRSMG
jgi:hypothetical protein